MEPGYDRSSYAIQNQYIPPTSAPSLINYVPSFMGGSFQSRFEDSTTDLSNSKSSVNYSFEETYAVSYNSRCEELWRDFRDIAGPWMTHRFTLEEWDCSKTTRTQLAEANVTDGTSDFDGCLTKAIIAAGLSILDSCPVFFHYSYTKCELNKKRLTDIEALGSYHYIQYLDVSTNKLTTLKPLGNLPFLKYLNASRNLLTTILDFKPPHFLTGVDLSYNKIKTPKDLSAFWSITDLNLSHNSLRLIDGLQELRYLTSLDLSYNRIETIDNLTNLRIQFLYLQNNQIQAFDDDDKAMLHTLNNIRTINLARNQVSSLKIFEKVENLENLEISSNHITQLLDIYYLRNLKYLNKLNLTGNVVTKLRRYVEVCITNISNLVYLDGEHINYEFWLQKLSNRGDAVNQVAAHQRLKLLILEQLNKPQMWDWILPYDQLPLAIIVLVGLQASKRASISMKFCQEHNNVALGIPHTTRTKHPGEIEGNLFYYVTEDEFRTMLKEGQFFTYQEHLGFYYGIAHSEFKKAEKGVLLFSTGLTMALSIRNRFFNSKLVLTLPSTRKIHLENLSKLYAVNLVDSGTMKIINSPVAVKYYEAEFEREKSKIIHDDIRCIITDLVTYASMQEYFDDSGLAPNDSSGILQIWSAPNTANQQGRTSRRIHPVDPFFRDLVPSITHSLVNQSKFVSFDGSQNNGIQADPQKNGKETGDERVPSNEEDVPSSSMTERSQEGTTDDDLIRVRSVPTTQDHFYTRHSTYHDILAGDERIRTIFLDELNRRDELLDLHWATPGLFRELLLTDQVDEAMKKLWHIVKEVLKSNGAMSKQMFDYSGDKNIKSLIDSKLKRCFVSIERELSISDKQAAEYFVDSDKHICDDGECKNSACPPFGRFNGFLI